MGECHSVNYNCYTDEEKEGRQLAAYLPDRLTTQTQPGIKGTCGRRYGSLDGGAPGCKQEDIPSDLLHRFRFRTGPSYNGSGSAGTGWGSGEASGLTEEALNDIIDRNTTGKLFGHIWGRDS